MVLKKIPAGKKSRLAQLAWFGGVALFFITLIFPIQFQRQWITIGWALEGAALLWLFHRVPHPGLRLDGRSGCSSRRSSGSRSIRPCWNIIRAPRCRFSTGIFTPTAS